MLKGANPALMFSSGAPIFQLWIYNYKILHMKMLLSQKDEGSQKVMCGWFIFAKKKIVDCILNVLKQKQD